MAQEPTPASAPRNIQIDGVNYDVNTLSRNARGLIGTIRMADREIRRLQGQLGLLQISRQTLGNSLKAELANPTPDTAAPNAARR